MQEYIQYVPHFFVVALILTLYFAYWYEPPLAEEQVEQFTYKITVDEKELEDVFARVAKTLLERAGKKEPEHTFYQFYNPRTKRWCRINVKYPERSIEQKVTRGPYKRYPMLLEV